MKIGAKSKVTREVTRQEQNRKNNIKRITISALVAFILFIALTIIQSSILNQEQSVSVYQFASDVNSGTKITEDNIDTVLNIKSVQASLIPENYITDKSEILGKYVNRNYKAKDIITTDGLTDSDTLYAESIKNPVKLAFSIDGLAATVVGEIREGDYVNIYGMRSGYNGDNEVVTVTNESYTFRHVLIEQAYGSDGTEIKSGATGTASVFTIIIEESDVELFTEMLNNCSLRMVKLMYDTNTNYQDYIDENNKSAANASKTTITEKVNTEDRTTSTTSEITTTTTSETTSPESTSSQTTSDAKEDTTEIQKDTVISTAVDESKVVNPTVEEAVVTDEENNTTDISEEDSSSSNDATVEE
jgi:hypothetical protein